MKQSELRRYIVASDQRVRSGDPVQTHARLNVPRSRARASPPSRLLSLTCWSLSLTTMRKVPDVHSLTEVRGLSNFRQTQGFLWRHDVGGWKRSFRARSYWLRRGRLPRPLRQSQETSLNMGVCLPFIAQTHCARSVGHVTPWRRLITLY